MSVYGFCARGQASSSQNYVMTNTVKQAGITNEGMVLGLPIATQGKSQSITYIDGLGRPYQTVITKGGATQKDIISANEYDAFGREIKKYMPYADTSNSLSPGSYRTEWQTRQRSFYNGLLQGVDTDTSAYSQSVLEASPLNRVLAQGAPGTVWQPNLGNAYDTTKKTIKLKYEINKVSDSVRIFNVDTTGAISSPGNYSAGLLTVKTSIDEHNSTTKEFTDKTGHLLLKKVYIDFDILQTYYIYDDFDLLRAVIQPEGVSTLPSTGSWTPDTDFIQSWIFLYTYDARNRMIVKQVPGATAVYMMYDKLDRLVLTQDGNLRANNQWLFNKYDSLNRPVMTGLITDARLQSAIQTSIDSSIKSESVSASAAEGYTLANEFPSSTKYTLTIHTITHYDSYANLPSWASSYTFVSENGVTSYNNYLQGQVVATQTRILGTSNWLRSVVYYDDKYRSIQSTTDNSANGKDRITRVLTFDGKPTAEYHSHTSNVYSTAILTTKTYTYDHADRVLKITHQLNTGETVTLADVQYNELGQLLNKKIHQATSRNGYLQKLDYAYNIRGWLNGINKPGSDETGYDESDLFNFELHYNTPSMDGSTPQFNGNIAEQIWKGGYDEYYRGFEYFYDKANRLTLADYGFKYLSNNDNPAWDFSMKYNEAIQKNDENGNPVSAYDHNGNIEHLERFHGSWNKVDVLSYLGYNGNKLGYVDDYIDATIPVGFNDKLKGTPENIQDDYGYDGNGNIVSDYNKGIGNITYNHLNLPTVVSFGTAKGNITYLYDAAGSKMQKTVTDSSVSPNKITITKYAGAFVYTNSYLSGTTPPTETLEFISTEEGRIRPKKIDTTQALTAANTKYIYDYFMKDHLGNTRMVLTTENQTDLYAATNEVANATKEGQLFNNIGNTTKPSGFDTNGSNGRVAKVNGSTTGTRIGPSIVLKVMAGDTIGISSKAWYTGPTQAPVTGLSPIADQLLTLISNGIVATGGTHGGAIPSTDINSALPDVLDAFFSDDQPYNSARPKAFLNWMVVDEEFKKTSSSFHMGAVQVPVITDSAKQLTGPANMVVRRNGWLYVYVSNESNQDVYFDDLIINHKRGPAVEMNNYYAFGLEIPGLNSKAVGFGGNSDNRKKFNKGSELQNKEFSDGSGLELYDATFRMYDPQIGRFCQIDQMAEDFEDWSPYTFANNNPILLNDPLGLAGDTAWKTLKNVTVTAKLKPKMLVANNAPGVGFRSNPYYNPFMNKTGPSVIRYEAWNSQNSAHPEQMSYGDAALGLAAWLPWGRVVKGVGWLYKANKARQALRIAMLARFAKLTPVEQQIVNEANLILNSKNFSTLTQAYQKGVSAEITVGSRTILYEPSMSASGFTLFGEGNFVLGNEAFTSSTEVGKTVLHELYRLSTSLVQTNGATRAAITAETNAASQFAEKAAQFLK